MPTYQYACSKCNAHFELKQGFHDEPEAACPKCHHKARRLFIPAPIIFKGSGFYVTDNRGSNASYLSDTGKSKTDSSKAPVKSAKPSTKSSD